MPGALGTMQELHLSEDELVAVVLRFEGGPDDELDIPDDSIREMIAHIESCSACRAERDRLVSLLGKLHAMPEPPAAPPSLGDMLRRFFDRLVRRG